SAEEHTQILQTIEMFEAITQTQPEDYQSLEILREAYTKIGRQDEALRISRKLAEAYFNAGSYTPALHPCEVILTREPNAPEIFERAAALQGRGGQRRARVGEECEQRFNRAGDGGLDAGRALQG